MNCRIGSLRKGQLPRVRRQGEELPNRQLRKISVPAPAYSTIELPNNAAPPFHSTARHMDVRFSAAPRGDDSAQNIHTYRF